MQQLGRSLNDPIPNQICGRSPPSNVALDNSSRIPYPRFDLFNGIRMIPSTIPLNIKKLLVIGLPMRQCSVNDHDAVVPFHRGRQQDR